MHPFLRRVSLNLRRSFVAISAIFFLGFLAQHLVFDIYLKGGKWTNSFGEPLTNIILGATIVIPILIGSLALTRAIRERNFAESVRDGALWTAGLFLAFVLLVPLASLLSFQLTGPHAEGEGVGGFDQLVTTFDGQFFGCKEELLFGLTPWFCGDAIRALADGVLIGAAFFSLAKAAHNALPEHTPTMTWKPMQKAKPRKKTRRKPRSKG